VNPESLYFVSLSAPVISAVIALFALFAFLKGNRIQEANIESSRDAKKVDILIQTTQRFVDIWEQMERMRAKVDDARDVSDIYTRFWSLQREQYRYWCMGFIDDSDFRLWMQYRHKECEKDAPIGGISYRTGAETALKFIAHKEYTNFVRLVLDGDIDAAMARKSQEAGK
jgi:hypothetical protein